jgi:hypothetical protein
LTTTAWPPGDAALEDTSHIRTQMVELKNALPLLEEHAA